MRAMKTSAAIALAAALLVVGVTPARAASPFVESGSCVYESAGGIDAAVGSASWIEIAQQGLVDRTIPCTAPFVQPLGARAPVSSPYGVRVHPITGATTMHWGTDYSRANIRGAAIRSIAAGTVVANVESYATSGAGNTIVILHADNVRSQYMHMAARSDLPVGAPVTVGQVIGYVGTTGGSTGPHLHLEIRVNGTHVDPVPFLANSPYLR